MTRHYSAEDCERDEAFPPKGACACRVDFVPLETRPVTIRDNVQWRTPANHELKIVYCKLHQAAWQMREALQAIVDDWKHQDTMQQGIAGIVGYPAWLDQAQAALTASQEVP